MPRKDRKTYNSYMKNYMRQKRLTDYNYRLVLAEFKQLAILPRHMYDYRQVMREMLKSHFGRKAIKVNKRTDLISQSILFSC